MVTAPRVVKARGAFRTIEKACPHIANRLSPVSLLEVIHLSTYYYTTFMSGCQVFLSTFLDMDLTLYKKVPMSQKILTF